MVGAEFPCSLRCLSSIVLLLGILEGSSSFSFSSFSVGLTSRLQSYFGPLLLSTVIYLLHSHGNILKVIHLHPESPTIDVFTPWLLASSMAEQLPTGLAPSTNAVVATASLIDRFRHVAGVSSNHPVTLKQIQGDLPVCRSRESRPFDRDVPIDEARFNIVG